MNHILSLRIGFGRLRGTRGHGGKNRAHRGKWVGVKGFVGPVKDVLLVTGPTRRSGLSRRVTQNFLTTGQGKTVS